MGEKLLEYYRHSVKKEYKIAFIGTFLITLLIHLYKFTNTLPNHDSVFNYYTDQNVLGSGRWALSLACGISSYYDLAWINGLLSSVFIALTVVVIVALFKIKNPVLICLTGALLAASPATTETFFFMFTADGYMIAMLLAALSVYLSRIEEKRIGCRILSGVCICVSCGIYQAYVSFALLLAVFYFIDVLLQNSHDKKDCLKWILRQVIIYVASLASYYIIWKLLMHFSGTSANDYQGISDVGKISFGLLVNGLKSSVKSVFIYFMQWNVLENGFTLYAVLNIIFILAFAVGLIVSFIKNHIYIYDRGWRIALAVICLLAIIPFACIWHFTSDSVGYRAMMLQSLTLVYVFTALIYERFAKPLVKNIVCLLLCVIVFNNAIMANIGYFYLNECYERTYAEGIEMMEEINELRDEYEFDKIAVVGNRIFDVRFGEPGEKGSRIHILSSLIEETLLYDSEHTVNFLRETFGLDLEPVERSFRDGLLDTEEVANMGCWPSGDSVTVIDGILVIKLSDTKEG